MIVNLPEADEIYFSKTKEYFQEVISSYSIGNYRSATVMLYSVAICDILFKLQELKDMFNDSVAADILMEIDKSRSNFDNKSKSKWEKELLDKIHSKTQLLSLEAYTNLNHLYDHRNFSAHPALNENYELIAPSKETTIANIKNVLNDILIKPPIFIKNVVDMITEDLKEKKDLYVDAYDKLSIYLNNKYYSKMPDSMKIATFKAFWKFCFCLHDNEDCMKNISINRWALEILISDFYADILNYFKLNNHLFNAAADNKCLMNLSMLLSKFPDFYSELNFETKLQIDKMVETDAKVKFISWFKYKNFNNHIDYLKSIEYLSTEPKAINLMSKHYINLGETKKLIDFYIFLYGKSHNYDTADKRFETIIEPFIDKMNKEQFIDLIKCSNENRQIWDRWNAYKANNKIISKAKEILVPDFDFSKFPHFKFNEEIITPTTEQNDRVEAQNEDDYPFN